MDEADAGRGHSGKSVAPRRTRNSSSIVVIFSLAADERTDGRARADATEMRTERGRETDREETNVLHRQLQGIARWEIIPFLYHFLKCKRSLPNKTLSDLFDRDYSKVLKGEKTQKYF